MPTYAFSTAKEITTEQRAKLVESVTAIHQVEATAPRYFVQVIFYKVEPVSIFIGGQVASPDHIWVRADIRSGRSTEQKARMLQRIMRETSEILGVSDQSVWVYISDIPAQGVLEFGNVAGAGRRGAMARVAAERLAREASTGGLTALRSALTSLGDFEACGTG